MSSKKRAKMNKKRAARKMDSMQYIALGVILVVVLLIAWLAVPKGGKDQDVIADAPAVQAKQYSAPPAMAIDVNKEYFATVKMAKGGEFVMTR